MRKFDLNLPTLMRWHTKFNAEYFGGLLSTPIFKIRHNSTRKLGNFHCDYIIGFSGKRRAVNQTITMYDYYDRTEKDFQTTFIHEMIHQWQSETYGVVDHKNTFRSMAANINRYGWNISRCSNVSGVNVAEGIIPRKKRNATTECRLLIWENGDTGKKCFAFATTSCAERNANAIVGNKRNLARWRNLQMYKVKKDAKTNCFSTNRKDLRYYDWDKYGNWVIHLIDGKENLMLKPWYQNAIANAV